MYDRPGIEGPLIFIVPSVHDNRISGPKITKMYNSCNFVKMIHACRMSDFMMSHIKSAHLIGRCGLLEVG